MEKQADFLLPVPLLKVHSWISFSKNLLLTFHLHLFIVSLYPFVPNPLLPYGLHNSSTLVLTLWVYIWSKELCSPKLGFIRLRVSSFWCYEKCCSTFLASPLSFIAHQVLGSSMEIRFSRWTWLSITLQVDFCCPSSSGFRTFPFLMELLCLIMQAGRYSVVLCRENYMLKGFQFSFSTFHKNTLCICHYVG